MILSSGGSVSASMEPYHLTWQLVANLTIGRKKYVEVKRE